MGKKSSKKKISNNTIKAEVVENKNIETKPSASTERSPEEREKQRIEGIKKTIVPGLIGIIGGIAFFAMFGSGEEQASAWYSVLFILLAIAYYAQRIIYPTINIKVREFGKKDWFYVEFLVLDFCLVTWTILLNL